MLYYSLTVSWVYSFFLFLICNLLKLFLILQVLEMNT